MSNKFVWMLYFHVVGSQDCGGKVFEISRDDDIGPADYRCRQYMSIVLVGQIERGNQVFEAADARVRHSFFHLLARAPVRGGVKIRALASAGLYPLFVDTVAPARPKQVCHCKTDQQVPDRGRIQHARIEQDDKCHA